MTSPEHAVHTTRLNPFAFPSDTDLRFVLLIAAIVGVSLFPATMTYLGLPSKAETMAAGFLRCTELAGFANAVDPADPSSLEEVFNRQSTFDQCRAPFLWEQSAWVVGSVAVLLGLAGCLCAATPFWKMRRGRLKPLRTEDAPEVVAYLHQLCREAQLSRPPNFLWNPLDPRRLPLAFGDTGRYYVAMPGGLVVRFFGEKPGFRSVMLHEFAHLKNADVRKTYFTMALWRAFLIVSVIPYLGTVIVSAVDLGKSPSYVFNLTWPLLPLVALVYLTRNSVLRARELYADVRASAWEGSAGSLRQELQALARRRGGWSTLLAVHPDPEARLTALDDTSRLFRMGFWVPFGTGIAAILAYSSVAALLSNLLAGRTQITMAPTAAALIGVAIAVGVVGSGVWRATFAAWAQGQAPHNMRRLGFALGLGLVGGQLLTFESALRHAYDETPLSFEIGSSLAWALSAIALLLFLALLFEWVASSVWVWLPVTATMRSPQLVYAAGLAIAGGICALGFGALSQQRLLFGALVNDASPSEAVNRLFTFARMIFIGYQKEIVALSFALWATPLAAWFWRDRAASASLPSWAVLDAVPSGSAFTAQSALAPRPALRAAMVGAGASGVALVGIYLWWRLGVSEATKSADTSQQWFRFGQVALVALTQATVAAVVAIRSRRLAGSHALFAAFVAGCLSVATILVLRRALGGWNDTVVTMWRLVLQVLSAGGILALLVVTLISVWGWIKRDLARIPIGAERRVA